jgi:tetratricopeptide (TPR) repeat protein
MKGLREPLPQAISAMTDLLESGELAKGKALGQSVIGLLTKVGHSDLAEALRALLSLHARQLPLAKSVARKLLLSHPQSAEYHYLNGIIAAQEHDIEACVGYCERALELDPELGLASAALALIHTLNQEWQAALIAARNAKVCGAEFGNHLVDLSLLASTWRLHLPNESSLELANLEVEGGLEELLNWLPPVVWPTVALADFTLFVYCDYAHFLEHAVPLVWSLAAQQERNVHVHLHIANPMPRSPALIAALGAKSGLSISWSHERVDPEQYGELSLYHSVVPVCRVLNAHGSPRLALGR